MNGSPKQAEEKRVSLRERSEPGPAAVRSGLRAEDASERGVSEHLRKGPTKAQAVGVGPRGTKEF